jgi:hypothetical protein
MVNKTRVDGCTENPTLIQEIPLQHVVVGVYLPAPLNIVNQTSY